MKLPARGLPREEILSALRARRDRDADWREGRLFSLVYHAGDDVLDLLRESFLQFFSENALNPMAFPSLRRLETEVVSMVADLLGHPDAAGSMTSGGTESILLAVKTARDHARAARPGVTRPAMLLPVTAHPAFVKAAHYFDVTPLFVPAGADLRADAAAARARFTDDVVLVVGSAPQYPHGVVDPIAELAALAAERGALCHVDACVGGMMLPFVRRLGYEVPPFDFAVPGVTSISVDLHKYGYAAKGASVLLFRSRDLRRHQFFAHADWPGGLFGSPSVPGTRPGGPIAAAWAVLSYLGEDGYLRLAKTTMEAARALRAGIDAIPGLRVLGDPAISMMAFASDELDVYAIADQLDARGWHLDRQQRPPSLHVTITAAHAGRVNALLAELRAAADVVRSAGPSAAGAAAMYGMLGALPDRAQVRDFILQFLDDLDRTGG